MKRHFKITFPIVLMSTILAITLGINVAFADDIVTYFTSSGWHYIEGNIDEIIGDTGWTFDVDAWEWSNAAGTRVDFDSVHYYNGWGDDYYNPVFNELVVADGDYNDWTTYYTFYGWYVDGINRTCDPSPDFIMDELDDTNDVVFLQQYVSYGAGRFSDFVISRISY